jgi:hypothetical protein
VIAMKVAEKNDIQPPWIKTCPFHRQQGRRSTVHEEEPVGGFDEIATLIPTSVAEGIATAENVKLHEFIQRLIQRCSSVKVIRRLFLNFQLRT